MKSYPELTLLEILYEQWKNVVGPVLKKFLVKILITSYLKCKLVDYSKKHEFSYLILTLVEHFPWDHW